MSDKSVSAQRVIAAPPEKIFDVLADPTKHPVIDGSGTVKSARGNPQRLQLGSKFGMGMRMGLPYLIRNTVVEFDDNRRIGWQHPAHNVWRYELEPVEGGTKVTETFDWSHGRGKGFVERVGFPERNRKGMEATLERLDRLVTTGSAD